MAGLGLSGAGGAQGFTAAIQEIIAQRKAEEIARQAQAYKANQDAIKNAQVDRTIKVDEGGLGLRQNQFEQVQKPESVANIASTNAGTAATTQKTGFEAADRSDLMREITGLSGVSLSPNRPSPRAIGNLMRLGVNMTTSGAERALVPAGQLGAEQNATDTAAFNPDVERQRANIKADADIRVVNARETAQNASPAPSQPNGTDMLSRALATAKKVKTMPGKAGATGFRSLAAAPEYFGLKPIAGTDEATFAKYVDTLLAQISLPNLRMMKGMGALSDAEGKRIQEASATLDRNMKDESWDAALDDTIALLEKMQAAEGKIAPMSGHATGGAIKIVRGPNGLMRQ